MIAIHGEIMAIRDGRFTREDNPLVHAPHTAAAIAVADWSHLYTREEAAFAAPWLRQHKFWPAVGRVDHVYGDRNLQAVCSTRDDGSVV